MDSTLKTVVPSRCRWQLAHLSQRARPAYTAGMSGTLAAANLTQRKLTTGVPPTMVFWVQEGLGGATGALATPLKVTAATPELMSVATYADVSPGGLPFNPLTGFTAPEFSGLTILTGDLLQVTPLAEWGIGGTVNVAVTTGGSSPSFILVNKPFWTKTTGLSWNLTRAGTLIASGSTGATQRANTGLSTFLDNQFQTSFTTPADALTHIAYTQTMLASLVSQIELAATEYLTAAPGNPIITNFVA